MKVTKQYCDICEKEILKPKESMAFRISCDNTALMVDYNGIENIRPRAIDICKSCHEAIQEALDSRRAL